MQVIKTLSTERSKRGDLVEVKHINLIGNSPVMFFYLKHYVQLNEAGHGHPVLNANNNSSAVFAEVNGTVVGAIVYKLEDDPLKTTWKILSAVESSYRARGIYKMMHVCLERMVTSMGSKKIASHVHIDNITAQAGNKAMGLTPVWFKMEKNIKGPRKPQA